MLNWLKKLIDKNRQSPSASFMFRFCHYADEAGLPDPLRKDFCMELYAVRDNPLNGQRVGEKYFAMYEFSWPQGTEEIKRSGKKGTYKQHCQLFARKVCRIIEYSSQDRAAANRAQKRSVDPRFFPYAKIEPGPSLNLCPVHSKYFGKFLPHGDPALNSQFREHPDCKCWIQIITQSQYDSAQKK